MLQLMKIEWKKRSVCIVINLRFSSKYSNVVWERRSDESLSLGRTSRRTVVSDGRDDSTKWMDRTSFHIHFPLLTFFLSLIVLFHSCCYHAQVFGKALVHEFPIFHSHTEWNLFSSGTNTILWWRACCQKLYKQTLTRSDSTMLHKITWLIYIPKFRGWLYHYKKAPLLKP